MRRTILILSTLLVTLFFMACGERSTTVTNANAGGSTAAGASGNSTTTGGATGGTAGIGPENQGIGGTSEGNTNAVNGNTYTVPPGFNKNGDRGSATNVSKTP